MKSLTYPFALLVLASPFLYGCSTVQQLFAGEDCECEPVEPCEISTEAIAHSVAKYEVENAHLRALAEGAQTSLETEDDEADPGIRSAEDLAHEPIDPTIREARIDFDDDEDREAFAERYDIDILEGAQVYRHRFHPDDPSAIAVHHPGQSLRIYVDGGLADSVDLERYDDTLPEDQALPASATAIDLVRDRPTQLQLLHAETDEEGDTTFFVTIYKIIGPRIGTIFHKPIATTAEDGSISPLAEVRYLYGIDARIIEWHSPDDDDAEPERYHWNQWEGVYRIPRPPPTAPDPPDG